MSRTAKTINSELTDNNSVVKNDTSDVENIITDTPVENINKDIVSEKKEEIVKTYKPDDLISCRSVTVGELLCPGKKTGELYVWANYGDTTEVEYQDLLALRTSKSKYIYEPLFIIEDNELLKEKRWSELNDLYEKIYSVEDFDELFNLSNGDFEAILKVLPNGVKNSIKIEVGSRIEKGTFDSIQKIKIIDKVCNSDLKCLL